LHIHHRPLAGRSGKRRLGVGGHGLMSGCPEHWTIQHKLKSTRTCAVQSQCMPVPDRQMDTMANNATIRSNEHIAR